MRLDGVGKFCRRRGTFLVDVNDWDCESRDTLRACGSDGTTVVCSSGGVAKELMSNESRLLDLLAAARKSEGNLQKKTIAKYVRQHKCGVLGAVGHCEEFDPALVQRAKMEEKDFTDKMGVYDVVPRSDAAEKCCRVIRTRWVTVNKGTDDAPRLRAGWVAEEFRGRCGDKHEYFSETPDLALVKALIAHAARLAESEDIVVAVFDVRRAYFYTEEKRDIFVEMPDYVPAEFQATHAGNLRKALHGTRPAAASWGDELRKGLVSCNLTVDTVSRCCFQNELCCVAGTVHGDDIFVTGPRQEKAKMEGNTQKETEGDQMIGPKPGDQKELRILNRTLRWCKDGLVFAANLRHGREVVDEMGLSKSKPVSSPATGDGATRCRSDEVKPLDEEERRLYQRIVAKPQLSSA